ncbi:hypothetical protein [Sulfurospirillum diekertiae]|uniref:Uncharacterized protein n=1 Tax=Sulfurospirillum diekertiae TaxID=1854492 RepID=A0AA92JB46_9BACT|nr:hypothetical protein [Sulfurospirillum diekertiae]QNA70490.1 hypothetical protein FA584_14155 [Sulfurospirillum diekertiae]
MAITSQIQGAFEGFKGDTIIELTNGEKYKQAEYFYEYHYAYSPNVTIINSTNGSFLKIDGIEKEFKVTKVF